MLCPSEHDGYIMHVVSLPNEVCVGKKNPRAKYDVYPSSTLFGLMLIWADMATAHCSNFEKLGNPSCACYGTLSLCKGGVGRTGSQRLSGSSPASSGRSCRYIYFIPPLFLSLTPRTVLYSFTTVYTHRHTKAVHYARLVTRLVRRDVSDSPISIPFKKERKKKKRGKLFIWESNEHHNIVWSNLDRLA